MTSMKNWFLGICFRLTIPMLELGHWITSKATDLQLWLLKKIVGIKHGNKDNEEGSAENSDR